MLSGIKNKLSVFIILFGLYNIIVPIVTQTTYDPNNVILLAVSMIAFVFFLFIKRKHDISLVVVLGLVAFSLIFITASLNSFSYLQYTKWLIFVISLFFYYIMFKSDIPLAEGNYRLLYLATIVQIVLFVMDLFNASAYTTMESGTFFISCFDNKNATAMHLLTLCCIMILFAQRAKTKKGKLRAIIPLAAFGVCVYLLILTGSRSSLVGAIFIIPFYFLPKLKRIVSKPVIFLFLIFPFVFAAVYVALYQAGYQDLQLFGRALFNGREDLWIQVFNGNFFDWTFGMYSQFARPDGMPFQLHNGTIDLIGTYGLIITVVFLGMIYKMLAWLYSSKSEINRMIVICVCALILQSVGEAALFNGTRVVYICMILMFIERKQNNAPTKGDTAITTGRIKNTA